MNGIAAKIGAGVLVLALLVSLVIDFANTAQGGGIDLRNRITGVRLLEHGVDPYHYHWQYGDPTIYCDVFDNPKIAVTRTTVTPAFLLLHAPLGALPYRLAQFSWFLLQWALLLATGALWLCACTTSQQRWLVALFVTGFTYTAAWRVHAERGQAYIALAFLLALWLVLSLHPERRRDFLAGCVAGLLVAFRPSFGLLLPFVALHRRGQLAGAALGLVVGFGTPLLVWPQCWSEYAQAVTYNSDYYRHFVQSQPGERQFPGHIEGVPINILSNYVAISYADASLFALLHGLGADDFPALPMLLAVLAPFAIWLWLTRRAPVGYLLTGIAAWYYLADFALPAYRNSYNDVIILDVFAIALISSACLPWMVWPCLIALPAGWLVYACSPDDKLLINVPAAILALGAVLALLNRTFLFNNRGGSRKVGAAC